LKIRLIAAPFLPVPPPGYGGTELFVGHFAEGLHRERVEVAVYTNGESTVNVERRSLYPRSQWPVKQPEQAWIRELNHSAWSMLGREPPRAILPRQDRTAESCLERFSSPGDILF